MTLERLPLIESYTVHPSITHGNCSVLSSSWVTYIERSDASKFVGGDWKRKRKESEAFNPNLWFHKPEDKILCLPRGKIRL